MERDADQPAHQRAVHADELQVAADRIFDPVRNRLRIPAADRIGHQLDDIVAVAGHDPDDGPSGRTG